MSYEAEEADTVGARPAAAEETGDGEQQTDDGEDDWNVVDDEQRVGRIVLKQRPEDERISVDVDPDREHYQSPTADLQWQPERFKPLRTYNIYFDTISSYYADTWLQWLIRITSITCCFSFLLPFSYIILYFISLLTFMQYCSCAV